MRYYTVHENLAVRDEDDAHVFVKEGFCWPALFIPLVWMIYHRLWLVTAGYVGLTAALAVTGELLGWTPVAEVLIALAVSLAVAFEANDLRRWTLERHGYRLAAVVRGENQTAAEHAFFRGLEAPPGLTRGLPADPPVPPRAPAPDGTDQSVLGLFPRPGAV